MGTCRVSDDAERKPPANGDGNRPGIALESPPKMLLMCGTEMQQTAASCIILQEADARAPG